MRVLKPYDETSHVILGKDVKYVCHVTKRIIAIMHFDLDISWIKGIKISSRVVCYHNPWEGACRQGIPIPRLLGRGFGRTIRTSFTAKEDLISIDWITTTIFCFYFQFHPMEFRILHLYVGVGAWSKTYTALFPLLLHVIRLNDITMTVVKSHRTRVPLPQITKSYVFKCSGSSSNTLYLQWICKIHWTLCCLWRNEGPIESHWNCSSFRQRSYGVMHPPCYNE